METPGGGCGSVQQDRSPRKTGNLSLCRSEGDTKEQRPLAAEHCAGRLIEMVEMADLHDTSRRAASAVAKGKF